MSTPRTALKRPRDDSGRISPLPVVATNTPDATNVNTSKSPSPTSSCADITTTAARRFIPRLMHSVRPGCIVKVALTGGPCGGKSSFLARLQSGKDLPPSLQAAAVRIFCVPEAATLLTAGGLSWADATDDDKVTEFQLALLRTQIVLEDQFYAIAKTTGQHAVIVCDRGVMDGRAYSSESQFNDLLRRGGYNHAKLRDERYDAVLHFVSAAVGAPEAYNLDNPSRYENLEGAQQADMRLRDAYVGVGEWKIIDNIPEEQFASKLQRGLDYLGNLALNAQGRNNVAVMRSASLYASSPQDTGLFEARRYLLRSDIPAEIPVVCAQFIETYSVLFPTADPTASKYLHQQFSTDPSTSSPTEKNSDDENISPSSPGSFQQHILVKRMSAEGGSMVSYLVTSNVEGGWMRRRLKGSEMHCAMNEMSTCDIKTERKASTCRWLSSISSQQKNNPTKHPFESLKALGIDEHDELQKHCRDTRTVDVKRSVKCFLHNGTPMAIATTIEPSWCAGETFVTLRTPIMLGSDGVRSQNKSEISLPSWISCGGFQDDYGAILTDCCPP